MNENIIKIKEIENKRKTYNMMSNIKNERIRKRKKKCE